VRGDLRIFPVRITVNCAVLVGLGKRGRGFGNGYRDLGNGAGAWETGPGIGKRGRGLGKRGRGLGNGDGPFFETPRHTERECVCEGLATVLIIIPADLCLVAPMSNAQLWSEAAFRYIFGLEKRG
jgi:hypothetical protein